MNYCIVWARALEDLNFRRTIVQSGHVALNDIKLRYNHFYPWGFEPMLTSSPLSAVAGDPTRELP
jgi:hypothetical protein